MFVMLKRIKLLTILLLFPVLGCSEVSKADKLNVELPTPTATPKKNELAGNNKLFVFVGEKISVEEFIPPTEKDEIPFDQSFRAKYKVIQNVYGDYDKEIIEFQAFDHYGNPPFAKYKTVLLFVSEHKGKLYHEKYQYYDVNQTKDGRWASCGDPYRFDEYHRRKIEPAVLEFGEPVAFDIEKLNQEQIRKVYPAPFFRIEGKKAVCSKGAFVEDLFIVKKKGVLKARGLFK